MSNTKRKYLYGHTSPETAKVVEDYPWGYTLRTTIRYWIESKDAKNGGQRFARQTINPKTGKWCAVKYSTYRPIIIMFLDDNDYVQWTDCDFNDTKERVAEFKETHLSYLTDFQKSQLKVILAYQEVMQHVTFTVTESKIGPVSLFSKDPIEVAKRAQLLAESDDREAQERESFKQINRAIACEMTKINL